MDLVLENCRILKKGKFKQLNIGIKNGLIERISEENIPGKEKIDCFGKTVLPGAIDVHVHFRIPGMEWKEDWETGSKAALAGGITTVMDMPNTVPPTTTPEALEEKRKIASENSFCDFGFHFGASSSNLGEIKKAKGIRRRRTVCGNTIHAKISQINLKVLKEGAEKLGEEEAPKEAEKKAEAKPAAKEKKAEAKPTEKKAEEKEVAAPAAKA